MEDRFINHYIDSVGADTNIFYTLKDQPHNELTDFHNHYMTAFDDILALSSELRKEMNEKCLLLGVEPMPEQIMCER
jgi:hypothetical protein